jgi:hypothetical protein
VGTLYPQFPGPFLPGKGAGSVIVGTLYPQFPGLFLSGKGAGSVIVGAANPNYEDMHDKNPGSGITGTRNSLKYHARSGPPVPFENPYQKFRFTINE